MQLYKPNKSGTGHGLGLRFNSKDQNLFLSLIKQTGTNENGKGTFNGGKQVVIALGAHEIGGILSVIYDLRLPIYETDKIRLVPKRREQKYHHESEKQSVQLKFAPYADDAGNVKGLSLSVKQTVKEDKSDTSYSFWFAPDEMALFEQYLEFVLKHFFSAEYSAEKKRFEDSRKNGNTAGKKDPFEE